MPWRRTSPQLLGNRPVTAADRRLFGSDVGGLVPRQQVGESGLRFVCDAGENVGEAGLRIDVVEFGGLDQRVHDDGSLGSALRTGEQPGLSAQRQAAQRSLGGVVGRQMRPSSRNRVNAGRRLSM